MRYCKQCFEPVERKGFCRVCRQAICLTRFGWHHDDTGSFMGYKNTDDKEGHQATPGGKAPKRKKEKVNS
jgi:hypothetical protein